MRTWSAVSQKGGSGKTTVLAHLSAYAVECGEKVIVIDLDPQESAVKWHGKRVDSDSPGVVAALVDNLPKMLDAAATLGYTLAFVDTAGKTDAGAVAAVRAADLIITPSQPTFFAVEALKDTVELIRRLGKLDQAVCIINQLTAQSEKQDFADAEMQARAVGIAVSPAYLVHRRAYQTSIEAGKGVTEYKPKKGQKDTKAIAELHRLWAHLNSANPVVVPSKEQAKP
jgi:chromosome partitioning protein